MSQQGSGRAPIKEHPIRRKNTPSESYCYTPKGPGVETDNPMKSLYQKRSYVSIYGHRTLTERSYLRYKNGAARIAFQNTNCRKNVNVSVIEENPAVVAAVLYGIYE